MEICASKLVCQLKVSQRRVKLKEMGEGRKKTFSMQIIDL